MNRHPVLLLLALTAACSQRSQWRVIEPVSTPSAAAPAGSKPETKTTTADAAMRPTRASRAPALSMVTATPAPDVEAVSDATSVAHLKALLFPVGGGVQSTRLDDSFDAPRDGGARKHNAIDIIAPRGTPVLAVADGQVLRLQKNTKGGLTLYASDLEQQYVYYFAHLDRYHPKVYSGKPLMRGDTLGFVGTTGNSPKDLPHLHFQVMKMPSDGRYLTGGAPVNPYPLLRIATEK